MTEYTSVPPFPTACRTVGRPENEWGLSSIDMNWNEVELVQLLFLPKYWGRGQFCPHVSDGSWIKLFVRFKDLLRFIKFDLF